MDKRKVKKVVKPKRSHEIKQFVRQWREHRGLSVDRLGEKAGISGSMISQLERGKTTYTQATLEKLAVALDCQAWQLLASGPKENKALWDHVLRITMPDMDFSTLEGCDPDMLMLMVTNNCEAAVMSCLKLRLKAEGWRDSIGTAPPPSQAA